MEAEDPPEAMADARDAATREVAAHWQVDAMARAFDAADASP